MINELPKAGQEAVASSELLGIGTVLISRSHGGRAEVVKESSDFVWLKHRSQKNPVWRNRRSTVKTAWKKPDQCRYCHALEDPYWSRIMPMGYFCSKCGKPWTENDGVE